jgi:hypothetical protein
MKIQILKIAIGLLIIFDVCSCYNTSVKKEEVATSKESTTDIFYARQKAYLDSASEYMLFSEEAEKKLSVFDHSITVLKEKLKLEPIGIRVKYQNQLDDFDQKNAALEVNIEEYRGGYKAKWQLFKKDFNKEMDELGKSIDAMTENLAQKN